MFSEHKIRPEKRLAIHIRDRFTCLYCSKSLFDASPGELTLDHYIPVELGGSNSAGNLLTCCNTCNSRKNAHTAERYFMILGKARGEEGPLLHDFIRGGLARARYYLNRPINRRLAKALVEGRAPTLFDSVEESVNDHVAQDQESFPLRP